MFLKFNKLHLLLCTFIGLLFSTLQASTWEPPIPIDFQSREVSINEYLDSSGVAIVSWNDSTDFTYESSIFSNGSWSSPVPIVGDSFVSSVFVAVNQSLEAAAAWIDNSTLASIQAAIFTGGVWVPTSTIVTGTLTQIIFGPNVAIDSMGNIIVTYAITDSSTGVTTAYAANHNGVLWVITPLISTSSTVTEAIPPIIALNTNGDGALVGSFVDSVNANIYVIKYTHAGEGYVTQSIFSAPAEFTFLAVAVNNTGGAVAAWDVFPNGVYATIYSGGAWSLPATLVPPSSGSSVAFFIDNAINDSGTAMVTYTTNGPPNLVEAAIFNGSSWITQTVFSSTDFNLADAVVDIDNATNSVIAWAAIPTLTGDSPIIQASHRNGFGSWSTPPDTVFTEANIGEFFPFDIVIPPSNTQDAILLWRTVAEDEGEVITNTNISIGVNLFAPTFPSNLQVRTTKCKFLTQTDIVNRLTWRPSSDPSTVVYNIYRNGVLIAQVPASGPFVYLDHNRKPGEVDTYTVTAVNSGGVQSGPITFTIVVK